MNFKKLLLPVALSISAFFIPTSKTAAQCTFTAPYSEGFNGTTLPTCWSNSNSITSTSTTLLWKFTGTPGYGTTSNGRPTGSYAWVDASSPYTAEVILTSPEIDVSGLTAPLVKFDWFKDHSSTASPNNNLQLEGYNGTTWVSLFNDTSNSNTWRTESIILPASFSSTTNAKFRFKVDKTLSGNFYDDVLLDSFSVITVPTCIAPGPVTASAVTATTTTVTWTASSSTPTGGYQYEVRSSGAAGSGTTGLEASGTTASGVLTAAVTGLPSSTNLVVYVRANCGTANGFSVWSATSFTTLCATFTAPFQEGFNSGSLPNCWDNTNSANSTSTSMFWKFSGTPGYGTTSNGRSAGTYAWLDASSPYNAVVTLTSPVIDLSPLTTPFVKFDWFKDASGYTYPPNSLQLEGYNGTAWISLFNDSTHSSIWRTEGIVLPASFSNVTNAQFRFNVDKSLSNYFYDDILLDSFFVITAPTCVSPSMVTATAVTSTTTTISWTASASAPAGGYQYEVRSSGLGGSGTTGLAASGSTAAGVLTASITGLTPATNYTVYVRANCGTGNGFSIWDASPNFTTLCATFTAPFTESFSSGSLPNCWDNTNSPSNTSTSMFWKFSGTPGYGTTSNGRTAGTYAWVDASSPYNAVVTLTTPVIDLSALAAPFVEFDWFKDASGYTYPANNLELEGYNGTAWVSLFNDTTHSSVWRTEGVPLPASFSNVTNAQFRFNVDKSLSGYFYDDVLVDNFSVDEAPPCTVPGTPVVSNITGVSATISWAASASSPAGGYQYEVRSSGTAGSGTAGLDAAGTTAAGVTTATATGLMATTAYAVYVRANCGGGNNSPWTPIVNFTTGCLAPVVALGSDADICAGSTITLDAGNIGSTYLWSTGETTQSIVTDTTGTYDVRVTNASGCVGRDTIAVTVNPLPIAALGADTGFCAGGSLTLDAGNAGSTYFWSTGASTQTILVTTAGTYSVQVTNATSCITRDTIVIAENPVPSVALGTDTTFCDGSSVTLNAGNAGSTYVWSTGDTTQTITATTAGNYFVQVTNASGCTDIDSIMLMTKPSPFVNLGADTAFCAGNSITLNAGNTGSTYVWSTGATTQTITAATSGKYAVQVTSANGCVGLDSIAVIANPLPVANLGADITICAGNPVALNAGNAGASYLWNTGAITQVINVTTAGMYSVQVTNANGCTDSDMVTVFVNPSPSVNLGADVAFCDGGSVTFDAGNAGASYLWNTGATTQTITASAAGVYRVRVTRANGCTDRDTALVTISPQPAVALGNDVTICSNSPVILTAGNPGATYLWNTGQTTANITTAAAGTYSVQVTNASGCIDSDTIIVSVNPAPSVDLGNDTAICGLGSIMLNAGGSAGNSYLWNTGITSQNQIVTTTGSYSVEVTNAIGCTDADTINVVVSDVPVAGAITVTGSAPAFTFTATGNQRDDLRGWSFGDGTVDTTGFSTTTSHTYTSNGTYTVTFYVANACGVDSVTTTVTVSTVGIDRIAKDGEITLFPNPASDFVNIKNASSQTMERITVLNALGAVVSETRVSNGTQARIDINGLAAGSYLIRIQLDNTTVVRRLQITK